MTGKPSASAWTRNLWDFASSRNSANALACLAVLESFLANASAIAKRSHDTSQGQLDSHAAQFVQRPYLIEWHPTAHQCSLFQPPSHDPVRRVRGRIPLKPQDLGSQEQIRQRLVKMI